MARIKARPEVRFSDVMPILEEADMLGGLEFQCLDERQAIHLCHRMNLCRRDMREFRGDSFDRFVIRVLGDVIQLKTRPTPDMSRARRLDGSPIPRKLTDEETERAKAALARGATAEQVEEAIKGRALDLDTE